MKELETSEYEELLSFVKLSRPLVIVVEGYESVGKGKVIRDLHRDLDNSVVYRPDYASWCAKVPRYYRWVIFASCMDNLRVVSKIERLEGCYIFDRGALSGAVYNDAALSSYLPTIISKLKVLHILVTTDLRSYKKFQEIRGALLDEDSLAKELVLFHQYTELYRDALESSGIPYVEFHNIYNEDYAKTSSESCLSCGHYNYGICKNPKSSKFNEPVDSFSSRCSFSGEKELQDEFVY